MFINETGEDPTNPKKTKKKPSKFNKKAFKHAISMVESSGGKFMWNKTSSATGKYQFLYNLIKTDPSMKGVSRREFLNRDDLQELVMDRALDGKLRGFTYGEGYANKLKKEFNSDYDVNSLTAMVHFLGPGNARKFLKDPVSFRVPGKVNLTGDEYISKFSKYFDKYNLDNPATPDNPPESFPATSPKIRESKYLEQPKDNIPQQNSFNMQDLLSKLPKDIDNYESRQDELNNFRNGGEVEGASGADELVTLFEGGGTHEENPLGGIPQGMGANGKPNLVEEGETKWNDYIFSNAYDMEGNYTGQDGSKSNVFKKGGMLKEEGGSLSGSSCGGPGQPPCDENYNEKIRNSRGGDTTYVTGEKGNYEFFDQPQYTGHEPSTHLMSDDNVGEAWPSIAKNSKGKWVNQSQEEARKNKETYSFDNTDDLYKFAREGSWKSNSFKKGGKLDPTDPPSEKDKQSVLDYISNMNKDSDMQSARDRANSQSIRPSDPEQSFWSKSLEVALNPMTAAGYVARGKDLPDNFSRGPRNALDHATDLVNPAQYVHDTKNVVQGAATADGMQFLEGAAGLAPVPLLAKGVKSGAKNLAKSLKTNPSLINVPNIRKTSLRGNKAKRPFKSEIDWRNWNKEITGNKVLKKEYDAIEKQHKDSNTWMKYSDGSKFEGSPEQFVQMNSKNLEKFAGSKKEAEIMYKNALFHGSPTKGIDKFDISKARRLTSGDKYTDLIFTSTNKDVASEYAGSSGEILELIGSKGKNKSVDYKGEAWTGLKPGYVVGSNNREGMNYDEFGNII